MKWMDWLLKVASGGFLAGEGDRTQKLGAAMAALAVLTGVAQWAIGGTMDLWTLWDLVSEKWPVIAAGVVVYTGGAKVEAIKQELAHQPKKK